MLAVPTALPTGAAAPAVAAGERTPRRLAKVGEVAIVTVTLATTAVAAAAAAAAAVAAMAGMAEVRTVGEDGDALALGDLSRWSRYASSQSVQIDVKRRCEQLQQQRRWGRNNSMRQTTHCYGAGGDTRAFHWRLRAACFTLACLSQVVLRMYGPPNSQ